MSRSAIRITAILAAALITLTACASNTGTAPTPSGSAASVATIVQPTRPVEFVISTAVGGGSDLYARKWAAIIDQLKLSPQSVNPLNKEGASGAVAFTYVYDHKGDMHYIMVTLNSFFTTIITSKPPLPYKATDFTPIANLALDPFFLWVNEDSKWQNAQDFIKAAQEKSIVVTGTGVHQEDEVLFKRIEALAKTKPFTYVMSASGATVASALAGHAGAGAASAGVEATVNNPSEGSPFLRIGTGTRKCPPECLRPLCAFTPESPKSGTFAGLATCKSQGLAIDDYYIMRAVMGPPGLTQGQQAFWIDVFKQVFDSKDWKDYMDQFALEPSFKSGLEFRQFILQYQQLHQDIAAKNGWV